MIERSVSIIKHRREILRIFSLPSRMPFPRYRYWRVHSSASRRFTIVPYYLCPAGLLAWLVALRIDHCARNRISGGVRYLDLLADGLPQARKKSFLRRHIVIPALRQESTILFVICYVGRLVTTSSKSLRCSRRREPTLSLNTEPSSVIQTSALMNFLI